MKNPTYQNKNDDMDVEPSEYPPKSPPQKADPLFNNRDKMSTASVLQGYLAALRKRGRGAGPARDMVGAASMTAKMSKGGK